MEPQPRIESEDSNWPISEETKEIKNQQSLDLEHSHRNSSGQTRFGQTEIGKPKTGFPSYKVIVPLSLSTSLVFDLFKSACRKHKYDVSDQTQSSISATHQPGSKIRNFFACIVPVNEDRMQRNSSEIKLMIAVNERACTRIVVIKGISGLPNRVLPLIISFRESLEKAILKVSSAPLDRSSRVISE